MLLPPGPSGQRVCFSLGPENMVSIWSPKIIPLSQKGRTIKLRGPTLCRFYHSHPKKIFLIMIRNTPIFS